MLQGVTTTVDPRLRALALGPAFALALLAGPAAPAPPPREPETPVGAHSLERTAAYGALRARYAAPSSRYVALRGGLLVHVRDEGEHGGPVLVLLHGFGASAADFDAWDQRLGSHMRLVSLDFPGHGLTEAPPGYRASIGDLVDVVDGVALALGLERFVLVGSSLGGQVAWRYAETHPARLRGLVLLDAAGWRGPQGAGAAFAGALLRAPPVRMVLKALPDRPIAKRGLTAALLDPALVTPALVDRYVDFAHAPGHKDILLTIRQEPRDAADAAQLGRIAAPTLVMVGALDRLIPPADGRRFADAIPGSRLIVLEGVGHLPMEQAPAVSAAAVQAFVDDLPAAP